VPPDTPDATNANDPPPPLLICAACGYDLRGIAASDKCPECGQAIDRTAAGTSRIPWVRRRQIGSWRAYARTVVIVLFKPGRIAAEIARPVSFADARQFARRTALIAWTPIAMFFAWLWLASMRLPVIPVPSSPARTEWRWSGRVFLDKDPPATHVQSVLRLEAGDLWSLGFGLEVLVVAVLVASLLLWLTWICRAGSYFFHPGDQPVVRQNRAVALSYYACAPLALTPLAVPFVAFGYWSWGVHQMWGTSAIPPGHALLSLAAYALPALLLGWLLACNLYLMRRTIGCGAGRMIGMLVGLPVMWIVLTAAAALLPAAALLLALMLLSVTG
jgi:hypothetical protein